MGVCADHFDDKSIKNFILKNAREDYCDYCETQKLSIDLGELAEFIEESVESEYCEPYESGAPYDSEATYYENRFPGIHVYWTQYLLEDLVEVDNFKIVEDLAQRFSNDYWAETDGIYGPTKDDYFRGGWEAFKEILKHKVRFLFFDPKLKKSFEDEHNESLNPYYVLDEVGKAIHELGLIVRFPIESLTIYRARQHDQNEVLSSAESLGSPPPVSAKANRMSPAGISMFYGSFDPTTCRLEILDGGCANSAITTGRFTNCRNLNLVDFTGLTEVPSLFDEQNRDKRRIISFLISFIKDLSIPVKPDDTVHVEYIPTQVVTEFIKIKLGIVDGVDGIIYSSVKNEGEKCVVIFVDNEQIADSDKFDGANANHKLVLLKETITTENV